MGRLDDIIERNKNPGKARTPAADSAASPAPAAPATPAKGLDGMSRLDQIVERNKHPGKYGRRGVTMGVLLAAFVFLILVLIVFTDFDESPTATQPEPAVVPSGEKRVDGVLMYREPARRDAATDAP